MTVKKPPMFEGKSIELIDFSNEDMLDRAMARLTQLQSSGRKKHPQSLALKKRIMECGKSREWIYLEIRWRLEGEQY
jgi:hypothetical protein